MLYRFQPTSRELDHLASTIAASAGVTENDIEKALADKPETIFRVSRRDGPPVLVLKKSVRGARMADIIALDALGRLVLIECKRSSGRNHSEFSPEPIANGARSRRSMTLRRSAGRWRPTIR